MLRSIRLLRSVAVLSFLAAGPAFAGLHAGDIAPNFRGTDLNGVSHQLSDYRGKVVMLFVLGSA
jgi:hypothetical protein